MNNILSIEEYLIENKDIFTFTDNQIKESLEYLNSEDPEILEAWYNTVLDFAALVPGIGSVAEGINLVSYAKQGEYLLAGLCAIGLIPIFGQYIGAGGSLLVKSLRSGAKIGEPILKPLIGTIAKFFQKITSFLKSSKFLSKFSGIGPYVNKIISSLKDFVLKGGKQLGDIASDASRLKNLKSGVKKAKLITKAGEWLTPDKKPELVPVPQDAYNYYKGSELRNIRPYNPSEFSKAEDSQDWSEYL
jgi:hypothetical protein